MRVWCSCDAAGDIYFQVVASGSSTLDAWRIKKDKRSFAL